MAKNYKIEDNHKMFSDEVPAGAKLLKTIGNRPYFPYIASMILLGIIFLLLPKRWMIIVTIMAFITLTTFLGENYPLVSFYEGFLVVYSRNIDGSPADKKLIPNEDFISWEVLGESNKLQLFYNDNGTARSIIITTDNLTSLSSAFGRYYNENYGSRIRVQQFAERIKRFKIKEKISVGFKRMMGKKK